MEDERQGAGETAGAAPRLPGNSEVDELRASLDEIRRTLDAVDRDLYTVKSSAGSAARRAEPAEVAGQPAELAGQPAPPRDLTPPERRPLTSASPTDDSRPARRARLRRRSLVTLIAAAVLVVLALAFAVRLSVAGGSTSAGVRASGASPQAAGVSTVPGSDSPGSGVIVTVANGSTLRVQEQLLLVAPSSTPLALTLPNLAGVPSLRLPEPAVSNLHATVDDQPVAVTRTATGWVVTGAGGRSFQRVMLSYQLIQAVVKDASAEVDRALLVVTPLTAQISMKAGAPVGLRVANAQVRQASCLAAPVTQQLCGSAGADGWIARLPADSTLPLVVFQVDLVA